MGWRGRAALVTAVIGALVGGELWVHAQIVRIPSTQALRRAMQRGIQRAANEQAGVSVYVPDSSRAVEQLKLAERLEGQQEWGKAAEVYQEVIDQLGDRVLPADTSEDTDARPRYETVTRQVESRLCEWPPDGLRAYRSRYESTAREQLQAALRDDADASMSQAARLTIILNRYFPTETGLEAGVRLADLRIENGELGSAGELLRRLLDHHPDVRADAPLTSPPATVDHTLRRPALLFRQALVARRTGNAALWESTTKELAGKFPDAHIVLGGTELPIADALSGPSGKAGELALTPAPAGTTDATSTSARLISDWPMPGGDATRARLSDARAVISDRVGHIDLPDASRWINQVGAAVGQRDREDAQRASGAQTVILPVISGEELFFQDGFRVYAVSLESGMPLPGWAATYPVAPGPGVTGLGDTGGSRAGVFTLPHPQPATQGYQYSLTVTAESVLAVMGYVDVRDARMMNRNVLPSPTRLVRLDRATGKKLWEVTPADFARDKPGMQGLVISGSPIVSGESVYVSARGSKGNQFDDAYVLCFSYATGELKWTSYVASAAAPIAPFMDATEASPTVVHLAAAGGRIYCQTNLGAISALDAASGRPEWISLYPRDLAFDGGAAGINAINRMRLNGMVTRPWAFNAPMIISSSAAANPTGTDSGTLLVSLPVDSRDVLFLDAADGRVVKRVPRQAYSDADTLVYADDTTLVIASDRAMYSIEWRRAADTALLGPGETSALRWSQGFGGSPLRGKPFVARAAVVPAPTSDNGKPNSPLRPRGMILVPTDSKLLWVDLAGGKVMETLPSPAQSSAAQLESRDFDNPGNVVASADHVVIAGARQVDIWADLKVEEQRFRQRLAAAPNDPAPRLTWAEILFSVGREGDAFDLLDEALALLPPPPPVQPSPASADDTASSARSRLYTTALSMGDTVARRSGDKPATLGDPNQAIRATALKLYERAAKCAVSPAQQVEWRRRKASLLTLSGDLGAAVALWQQVLDDDALRDVIVTGATPSGSGPASSLAEREITEAIKRSPQVYAAYERQAADAVASATDPVSLRRIALRYPNSSIAAPSLFTAAQQLEATGDRRGASRVLQELYLRYPAFDRRADVLEAMARVYLSMPGQQESALARLSYGARAYPDRKLTANLTLADGTRLDASTFAQAAELLRSKLSAVQTQRLPEVRLPSYTQWSETRRATGRLPAAAREVPEGRIGNVAGLIPQADSNLPGTPTFTSDRIVVQLGNGDLAVIRPPSGPNGLPAIELTARGAGLNPIGCAFVSDMLIVWDEKSVAAWETALPDAARPKWRIDLDALGPMVQVPAGLLATDEANAGFDGDNEGEDVQVIGNGAQRILIRGRMRILAGAGAGAVQVMPLPAAQADNRTGERIEQVLALGDRLICRTSTGRVISFAGADGRTLWQTRLVDPSVQQMFASSDFVVVRSNFPASPALLALSAENGNVVWRSPAPALTSPQGQIVQGVRPNDVQNATLAPDGMLLFTRPDRICAKDLYDPSPALTFETAPDSTRPFRSAFGPDQLITAGDLLVAVTDDGQLVRAYTIGNECKPARWPGEPDSNPPDAPGRSSPRDLDALFTTRVHTVIGNFRVAQNNVRLQVVGRQLYAASTRSLVSFNLSRGEEDWHYELDDRPPPPDNIQPVPAAVPAKPAAPIPPARPPAVPPAGVRILPGGVVVNPMLAAIQDIPTGYKVFADFTPTRSFFLAATGTQGPDNGERSARLLAFWLGRVDSAPPTSTPNTSPSTPAATSASRESGLLLYDFPLDHLPPLSPAPTLVPVNGGVFYLAAGSELRFLRGTASSSPRD